MRSAGSTPSPGAPGRCGPAPRWPRSHRSPPASGRTRTGWSSPGSSFSRGPAALPVAWALASTAGARRLIAKGSRAWDTAAAAQQILAQREDGLLFVYLPDCDRAGHAHGWMSEQYLEAAAQVDAGLGLLSGWTEEAVFIVTADHGGGGVTADEHDEPHPVNDHIPLIVAGPGVTRRHQLTRAISLLDVPATVLWWFGVPVPDAYEGRPLAEAFAPVTGPMPVPA